MSCTEVVAIDCVTEALDQDIIDVVVIDNSVEATVKQTIEVDVVINQWSLVSDAIYIRDISGEEPQWFQDMVDNALLDNDELRLAFEAVQDSVDALENGYTNLVSITEDQATQIEALKVSDEKNTAAIAHLETVSITESEAYAISNNTLTAWMRGGESAAWFNEHVQAVATPTSANTLAITQLGTELDGISSTVTSMSEALVYKYQNPEWDETSGTDPDGSGNPQWVYEARAKHSLEVNANGAISGFIATAESCDPDIPGCSLGSRSAFKIYADEFMVCDKADPVTGEPGYVAFSIRFNAPADPVIVLNGDVYFGDITTGGVEIPYNLSDIASDLVVDPVEKDALEKTFKDIRERNNLFMALVYNTGARYGSLTVSNSTDTAIYTTAYENLQCTMAQLGIVDAYITGDIIPSAGPCSSMDPDTYIPQVPYAPTSISNRDTFNDFFKAYDTAYNKLDELMSDLVKEIADNSYNILVDYFSDGILSADEKTEIITYLALQDIQWDEAEQYMISIGAEPNCNPSDDPVDPGFPYPGNGFEPYSRASAVYVPFRKYENALYTTIGLPIVPICPCEIPPETTCPDLPLQPMNGFKVQMNLPQYELNNGLDTTLSQDDMTAALASFSHYLSAKTAYADSLSASVIDTTFIRISSPTNDDDFTLIEDDRIKTGVIGTDDYISETDTTRRVGVGIDFDQARIRVNNDDELTTFIIDSEIDPAITQWVGICDVNNHPNFRGTLIEASIGSFSTLYVATVTQLVAGKYPTRQSSIQSTNQVIHLYELGEEEFFTNHIRFYAPENPDVSNDTNRYRIRSFDESIFTANINGPFKEIFSLSDVVELGATLEYRLDDGTWQDCPNQIFGSTSSQVVMVNNLMCTEHIDFRLKINYKSNGFPYVKKNVILTIMLNN